MLLRQGVKAALPNAQKQTQEGCQIEETKKYGPNERTEQNSRKITKRNEIIKLSDLLVIRMLKELTGYINSIKMTQAEMKVTLSEIKKNLQGTNSGEDEAKSNQQFGTQGRKKHSSRTAGRKKISKKQG